MKTIELFFDFSSPNAYFATLQLPAVAASAGATLVYRPFFLGGLFKLLEAPQTPGMSSPEKARASLRDLERWSDKHGVPFRWPSRFPMNTLKALRGVFVLGDLGIGERAYIEAVFRAYWAEDRDIADPQVLAEVVQGLSGDGSELLRLIEEPKVKDRLRVATEEARTRGVFGAPVIVVGDELFFGKDRLDFVADALRT